MSIPTLPATASLSDLGTGLLLPFRAAALILRCGRLLLLSLACAVVTAATLAFSAWGSWDLARHLAEKAVTSDGTVATVASLGLTVLLFVAFFALAALTLPMLLLAPLQDPLSEATEGLLGGFTAPPFSLQRMARSIYESVAHTVLRLGCMLLGMAALLPLHLIPGVGSALWWALSTAWSVWWVAVEQLSNPMARHLYRFSQVLGAARKRVALSMGFGSSVYLLLWIPVLNCFLMPVAVVCATLTYRALKASGDLPDRG